ncbi:MAG: hypothetical protein K8H88_24355 [Sandaracinaceae bacterium]|nr:hypothetical protein [Sandaracinaceae bacterium]
MSFPVVHHAVARRYQLSGMPETYIVDRSRVVGSVYRGFQASDASQLEGGIRSLAGP